MVTVFSCLINKNEMRRAISRAARLLPVDFAFQTRTSLEAAGAWQRDCSPHAWGLRCEGENLLSEGNKVFPHIPLLSVLVRHRDKAVSRKGLQAPAGPKMLHLC